MPPSLIRAGIDPDALEPGKRFDLSGLGSLAEEWEGLWSAGHGVSAVLKQENYTEIFASLRQYYDLRNC